MFGKIKKSQKAEKDYFGEAESEKGLKSLVIATANAKGSQRGAEQSA